MSASHRYLLPGRLLPLHCCRGAPLPCRCVLHVAVLCDKASVVVDAHCFPGGSGRAAACCNPCRDALPLFPVHALAASADHSLPSCRPPPAGSASGCPPAVRSGSSISAAPPSTPTTTPPSSPRGTTGAACPDLDGPCFACCQGAAVHGAACKQSACQHRVFVGRRKRYWAWARDVLLHCACLQRVVDESSWPRPTAVQGPGSDSGPGLVLPLRHLERGLYPGGAAQRWVAALFLSCCFGGACLLCCCILAELLSGALLLWVLYPAASAVRACCAAASWWSCSAVRARFISAARRAVRAVCCSASACSHPAWWQGRACCATSLRRTCSCPFRRHAVPDISSIHA